MHTYIGSSYLISSYLSVRLAGGLVNLPNALGSSAGVCPAHLVVLEYRIILQYPTSTLALREHGPGDRRSNCFVHTPPSREHSKPWAASL